MKKVLYILVLVLALAGCKKQPYLNVDKSSLSLSSTGGTEQVSVSANYAWTASTTEAWIKVKYTEGDNVLKVIVSANDDTDGRQGTVVVKSEGLTVTVSVSQDQRNAIELEGSDIVQLGSEAQQVEVKLRSNVEVSAMVTDGSDWASVVSTKAMTSRTVTFSVLENDGKEVRRAQVSFKDAAGTVTRRVTFVQDCQPRVVCVTFQNVMSFQVPRLESKPGTSVSGLVFWDQETQGVPYDKSLSKTYAGAAGALRIEAKNARAVTFLDVKGLDSIDLSDF